MARLLVLAVLVALVAVAVPLPEVAEPLAPVGEATACVGPKCPPGGGLGICWGPHERPTCI